MRTKNKGMMKTFAPAERKESRERSRRISTGFRVVNCRINIENVIMKMKEGNKELKGKMMKIREEREKVCVITVET